MKTPQLRIYISDHCPTCETSLEVAEHVRVRFPEVYVTLCNIDEEPPVDDIFAVPTYVLDGKTIFLGNPTNDQIEEMVSSRIRCDPRP